MTQPPNMDEKHISQVPALQVLINLGWAYLTPDEADALRGGKKANVLLEGVLAEQLREINSISYKGQDYPFSEGNIHTAIQQLKEERFDGLVRTNEKVYDRLTLGTTLPQSIDGDTKSFPLNYIDWRDWENNKFHVAAEFSVARTASQDTRRPDIVLFVNGIPLAVIECKSNTAHVAGEGKPVDQAISQMIRNQGAKEIPRLFTFAQLLLGVAVNEARYATVDTKAKFWSLWRELREDTEALSQLVNTPLDAAEQDKLFSGEFADCRAYFEQYAAQGDRHVTEQDRTLVALCKPQRLLEFVTRYTVFDGGTKKVARYQQYFCVQRILGRVQERDEDGARVGGVVWHTQGSGKSLTMVMLAKSLALDLPKMGAPDFKIVLVTDRVDLDDQLYRTFRNCGTEPEQAKTGKHLSGLLTGDKSRIVTTVIDKFDAVLNASAVNDSDNIFVLVDESHRGQYGEIHAKMRKVLPRACFIGFTGTPVMKKEKNTIEKFGGLIDPAYTIKHAVEDGAVVPLLYEGRDVPQSINAEIIDRWFEEWTAGLTKKQAADLKKKYATSGQLNKVEQRVMSIAWDISKHYSSTWAGTPYKGQLVAPDKATALLYKQFLDEFGMVTSEVLISGPDDRDGHEEVDQPEELNDDDKAKVIAFWNRMMERFGGPKEYQRSLINSFKESDEPEIIIVVHKLLTGFDAPRNTVLYLCRPLKDHTLLQAIARVNRLYDGKEFGYIIDYAGVLQNLDKSLDVYGALPEFNQDDLNGTVTMVQEEVAKLAQRHSDLWDVFKSVTNKQDEEAYQRLLADEALRETFYERLSAFARTLQIALSTVQFLEDTPPDLIKRYKDDARFFRSLRQNVQRRYQEVVDFGQYEKRIQKLLNTHVKSGEVEQIVEPLNIFDVERREEELAKMGSVASKADAIAHATKRTITERMDEDPAFYEKFSKMLRDVIDAYRNHRMSDADYLHKVRDIMESVTNRTDDDIPARLSNAEVAKAFYGVVLPILNESAGDQAVIKNAAVQASLQIDQIILDTRVVDWVKNPDVQNRMKISIEDYLFDQAQEWGLELTVDQVDQILDKCLDIARVRRAA